ncbi:MAG: AMP-binding protein [Prevotella sp.]
MTVNTSGSTGKPKAICVEKKRMEASAQTTCRFLGLKQGQTALLCMDTKYIAGKMMIVRALSCGLRLVCTPPSGRPLRNISGQIDFAAMVPLQVAHSLEYAEDREKLRSIGQLIIGGGAIDEKLEQELRDFPNAVWSTYGMTETLSHIALRRLSGKDASSWYEPFEGISVETDSTGRLIIRAPQLLDGQLATNDLAELHPDGRKFRILGRTDNIICSGGVKIQIEEAERLLRPHLHSPFLISKRKDTALGETVVMLHTATMDTAQARDICRQILPHYWQPRHYVCVEKMPLTPTGKPDRAAAEKKAAGTDG